MPLPQGKLLASAETQAGVSDRFEQAMQELAIKGERQRAEKAKKDAEQRQQEAIERQKAPQKERLMYMQEQEAAYGSMTAADMAREDEEYDAILDEDAELDKLRQARLDQMKKKKAEYLENKAKGHGEYSEVFEDQFLKTVVASKFCVLHFYHNDFERSKIMDMHLKKIAANHVETKFIRMNAEKSPFFVGKLGIRVLPTLVLFDDGKAIDRVLGFTGLSGDEFKTRELEERLGTAGVIKMEKAFYEAAFEEKTNKMGSIGLSAGAYDSEEDYFSDE